MSRRPLPVAPVPVILAVKQLEFARRGDALLVNGSDRVIRVYATRDVLLRFGVGAPNASATQADATNAQGGQSEGRRCAIQKRKTR